MAIPALAVAAGNAAVQYGPKAYDAAKAMLAKATGGKVTSAEQIVNYVGKSQQRLTVVADSLIRSGIAADAIFPEDIVQSQPQLQAMRQAALGLAATLKSAYDQNAVRLNSPSTAESAAADVLRIKRVNAALEVFGSEEKYFLAQRVPAEDFAHVRAMKRALYGR